MWANLKNNLTHWWQEEKEAKQSRFEQKQWDQRLAQYTKLHECLPYETFDAESGLFYNRDTIGFVLETLPLCGATEKIQMEIDQYFRDILPEGSSFQTLLWADPHIGAFCDRWQAAREGHFHQRLAQRRVDYLTSFVFSSDQNRLRFRNFRCILAYCEPLPKTESGIAAVSQLRSQWIQTLEGFELPVLPWKAQQLVQTVSDLLSCDPTTTRPWAPQVSPWQSLASQLKPSPMTVEKNTLLTEHGLQLRSYYSQKTPLSWALSSMNQLIGDESRDMAQIPCPFLLHYGVHVPKQSRLQLSLWGKAAYLDKQTRAGLGRLNPNLRTQSEQFNFARQAIEQGDRLVQTQLSVTLFGTEATLPIAERKLYSLYNALGWQLSAPDDLQLPLFLSHLPMQWGPDTQPHLAKFQLLRTTLASEASNCLPLQGEWHGTESPGLLLIGRRGQVLTWSPFDKPAANYNVCVVGRSGSGKSVFMQELMNSCLGRNGYVFVLDVGRSFERTCVIQGGNFIDFNAKSTLSLNPFSHLPTGPAYEKETKEALAQIHAILALMATPRASATNVEWGLLQEALMSTWNQTQKETTLDHIAEWLKTHPSKEAAALALQLYPYTSKGTAGHFFNGPSTLEIANPLCVFELGELKSNPDLQAVVLQLIIINITQRMLSGDRQLPFHIILDEAWDLLRNPRGREFIESLSRTLRKHGGSLVIGTQSVNDLFANPSAQAVFDNSDWLCLLSQKSESIAQLKKTNRLTMNSDLEQQLNSLKTRSGHYAEVCIQGPHGYAITRLILDPYSQLLYSSRPEDYAEVQRLRTQGLSVPDALETILTQRGQGG